MTQEAFTIRVGDRLPRLYYKFPFSLAEAEGVTFSAKDAKTGEVFIERQAAVIAAGTYTVYDEVMDLTPADGVVFYPWAAGDTDVARKDVVGLFHISWPGPLQETLPSAESIPIVIGANF